MDARQAVATFLQFCLFALTVLLLAPGTAGNEGRGTPVLAANSSTSATAWSLYLPVVSYRACHRIVDSFDQNTDWPTRDHASPYYGLRINAEKENRPMFFIYHLHAHEWVAITRGDRWDFAGQSVSVELYPAAEDGIIGLLFGLNDNWTEFYSFELDTTGKKSRLFHYRADTGFTKISEHQQPEIDPDLFGYQMSLKDFVPGIMELAIVEIPDADSAPEATPIVTFRLPEKPGRVGLVGGSLAADILLHFDNFTTGCSPVSAAAMAAGGTDAAGVFITHRQRDPQE